MVSVSLRTSIFFLPPTTNSFEMPLLRKSLIESVFDDNPANSKLGFRLFVILSVLDIPVSSSAKRFGTVVIVKGVVSTRIFNELEKSDICLD